MTKKYKSDLLATIHEMAENDYVSGIIEEKTMEEFDESCLETFLPIENNKLIEIKYDKEI